MKRTPDRKHGGFVLATQQPGKLRRFPVIAVGELRQRRRRAIGRWGEQRMRERLDRSAARPHQREAPHIDAAHDPGAGQSRDQPGANQRGLTGSARTENQQERRLTRGGEFKTALTHAATAEYLQRRELAFRRLERGGGCASTSSRPSCRSRW